MVPRLACRCIRTMGIPLRRSDTLTLRDEGRFAKSTKAYRVWRDRSRGASGTGKGQPQEDHHHDRPWPCDHGGDLRLSVSAPLRLPGGADKACCDAEHLDRSSRCSRAHQYRHLPADGPRCHSARRLSRGIRGAPGRIPGQQHHSGRRCDRGRHSVRHPCPLWRQHRVGG